MGRTSRLFIGANSWSGRAVRGCAVPRGSAGPVSGYTRVAQATRLAANLTISVDLAWAVSMEGTVDCGYCAVRLAGGSREDYRTAPGEAMTVWEVRLHAAPKSGVLTRAFRVRTPAGSIRAPDHQRRRYPSRIERVFCQPGADRNRSCASSSPVRISARNAGSRSPRGSQEPRTVTEL